MSMTFDTLSYFEKLKAAGMPEEQAKVQVEVMHTVVLNYDETTRKELATKADLRELDTALRAEIKSLDTALRSEIKSLDTALRSEIKDLETVLRGEIKDLRVEFNEKLANTKHELLKWMVGLAITQMALMVALFAFLK